MVLFKCSVLGHQIYGVLNFYAATKWAVTALSEGLRKELAKKGSSIRVTVIVFIFRISKVLSKIDYVLMWLMVVF